MRLRIRKKLSKNKKATSIKHTIKPPPKHTPNRFSRRTNASSALPSKASSRRPFKRSTKLAAKLQNLRRQIAASHTAGYQTGYHEALQQAIQSKENEQKPLLDDGFNNGFDEGYSKGFYEGGDGLADLCLPGTAILPEISINQIIEEGIHAHHLQIYHLKGTEEIADRILLALEQGTALSVIRLGDGELLTLAQETVKSIEQVQKEGKFLNYAGVSIPDLLSRDLLLEAVKKADVVGIPKLRMANFQPLAFSVFNTADIDYRQLYLTSSTINYELYLAGYLPKLLANRRVLIVGNCAHDLAAHLTQHGFNIVGAVAPVQGMSDIQRVIDEAAAYEFDIALVAAGIPAVVLAQRIAAELHKVAIDFGHLANSMIKGEAPL